MTTLSSRPMNLFFIEFDELYARHLCRHSQFGINVAHLLCLLVLWFAVYSLLFWLTGVEWLLAVPALVYLAALLPNVPLRVFAASVVFMGLLVAAVVLLPLVPFWVYLVMIPVAYEAQSLSHKVWTVSTDMTEFNRKYPKGKVLFVVLLLYEVPIVLNFLLFAKRAPGGAEVRPQVQETVAATS